MKIISDKLIMKLLDIAINICISYFEKSKDYHFKILCLDIAMSLQRFQNSILDKKILETKIKIYKYESKKKLKSLY